MTVHVETLPEPENDNDLMEVKVTTVDAAGVERVYHVSIFEGPANQNWLAGTRVEPEPPEGEVVGPTERAYAAAYERIKAAGYEVVNRD